MNTILKTHLKATRKIINKFLKDEVDIKTLYLEKELLYEKLIEDRKSCNHKPVKYHLLKLCKNCGVFIN